ncbi:MAG: IS3 family transposase [Planctomycetia bacterium]|nr:IS3 family transposase [Planctomycetia bacterium]
MLNLHQELHQLKMDSAILRAGSIFIEREAVQRFGFIQEHRGTWSVMAMCRVLNVSPSGFYAWRTRPPNQWTQRRGELRQQIKDIFVKSRSTYGSPRVHAELIARGIPCCQKTVAKIMQHAGLHAIIRRKFQITTDSNHSLPVAENLLERKFSPARPNQVWVNDIMAVPTLNGWLYLVAVLDLFSRRVVGWSLGSKRTSELVITALQMALTERMPQPGLLHHSDRGSQYACHDFQNLLASHSIVCSMSRKGNCWDNAVMESFFGTLKQELLQHHRFATRDEAEQTIVEYISVFYNQQRRHSTLGYLTPAEYEARHVAGGVSD